MDEIKNIILNPVTIGLFASLLTFLYMKYFNVDKEENKKNSNNEVNLLIPFAVFVFVWFISYAYMESYGPIPIENISISPPVNNNPPIKISLPDQIVTNPLIDQITPSKISQSKQIGSKLPSPHPNIVIPPDNFNIQNIPDVFIELRK